MIVVAVRRRSWRTHGAISARLLRHRRVRAVAWVWQSSQTGCRLGSGRTRSPIRGTPRRISAASGDRCTVCARSDFVRSRGIAQDALHEDQTSAQRMPGDLALALRGQQQQPDRAVGPARHARRRARTRGSRRRGRRRRRRIAPGPAFAPCRAAKLGRGVGIDQALPFAQSGQRPQPRRGPVGLDGAAAGCPCAHAPRPRALASSSSFTSCLAIPRIGRSPQRGTRRVPVSAAPRPRIWAGSWARHVRRGSARLPPQTRPSIASRASASAASPAASLRSLSIRRSSSGFVPPFIFSMPARARSRALSTFGICASVPIVSMTALPSTRPIVIQVLRPSRLPGRGAECAAQSRVTFYPNTRRARWRAASAFQTAGLGEGDPVRHRRHSLLQAASRDGRQILPGGDLASARLAENRVIATLLPGVNIRYPHHKRKPFLYVIGALR